MAMGLETASMARGHGTGGVQAERRQPGPCHPERWVGVCIQVGPGQVGTSADSAECGDTGPGTGHQADERRPREGVEGAAGGGGRHWPPGLSRVLSGLGLLFPGDEDLSRDTSHLDRGHSGGVPVWTGGEAGPAVRVQTEEVCPGPRLGRGGNVRAQPGPEAWCGGRCPWVFSGLCCFREAGAGQARPSQGLPESSAGAAGVVLLPAPSVDPRGVRARVRGLPRELTLQGQRDGQ